MTAALPSSWSVSSRWYEPGHCWLAEAKTQIVPTICITVGGATKDDAMTRVTRQAARMQAHWDRLEAGNWDI
jgi:hypothetical protein